jgi:hypothetical protein
MLTSIQGQQKPVEYATRYHGRQGRPAHETLLRPIVEDMLEVDWESEGARKEVDRGHCSACLLFFTMADWSVEAVKCRGCRC